MTTAKGEMTKSRILEAAVDLLVVGGASRLNLDDVMRATGTSKGQLFHYYPGGKDELRQAATERQVERLIDYGTPTSLGAWQDWQDWFGQIVSLHVQQSEGDACEVAALAGRALDSNPAERAVISRVFTHWYAELRERLEDMRDTGLLRPDAPVEQLASLVISVLEGGAVLDKATASRDHLANALGLTLDLLRAHAA
jgi:TetR/AcrR family transcriptional regulator, transcriptional repressor for nem operon